MKKYVAMLLTVVIMSAPCAYAGDSVVSKSNQSILTINHVQYQYNYFNCGDDGIQVKITNLKTGSIDNVFVDNSTILLNGKKIGTITEEKSCEMTKDTDSNIAKKGSVWKKVGSKTKRITWAKGTAVAVVAAVIGAALGGAATGNMVVAAMGAAALGTLAGQCSGGKVSYTLYKSKVGKFMRYKWVWKFKANTGDSYGPYRSYATV